MVWSANNFIGAPNNSLLKSSASDDDIELYISEVEADVVDDSVYYITDEDVYDVDETSYVDDTYDEDDYYFSDADDDDYVNDEDLEDEDTDTDSDDTDRDPIVVQIVHGILSDSESSGSDKSSTSPSTTQQIDPNADPTNNG